MSYRQCRLKRRVHALWRAVYAAAGVSGPADLNPEAFPVLTDEERVAIVYAPRWSPGDGGRPLLETPIDRWRPDVQWWPAMSGEPKPITVPGASADWRDLVQRIDEDRLLDMTKAFPHGEAEVNLIYGLSRPAQRRGLTDRDLIALGVELGRLHPNRADCSDLGQLTRTELGNLYDIVKAWRPSDRYD